MAVTRPAPRKEARLELRLEGERRRLLDLAARESGVSTSAFVLERATLAAQEVLANRTTFVLPQEHWDAFVRLLGRPVQPVDALAAFLAEPSVLEPE
jgi:uncharacterized protein (DUF1778 family)